MMRKVGIITDSTASIPDEMLEELKIRWVPYYIHRGKEVLRDLVNVRRDEFYNWLATAGVLPKTANPSSVDFENCYRQLAEEGIREMVSIHITSKNSGAYQAASIGKAAILEEKPDLRIEIIDSLNVAMCHGWMVIEAARAALAGASIEQILAKVNAIIPLTRMIQTADTLKYLAMGGRIGKAKCLLGSMLQIKPLIGMQDGLVVPLGRAFTRLGAYKIMAAEVAKSVAQYSQVKVAYVHAAARDEVMRIKSLVEEKVNVVEEIITELPPSLGVHSGPGTAGICFYPVVKEGRG